MIDTVQKPILQNGPICSPAYKKYGVVILNRYPELVEKFIASIRATHEKMPAVVVVRDGHDKTFGDDVKIIDGIEPFVYARNSNLGIQYFGGRDVFLCNDDIELVEPETFPMLHAISHIYRECGLLSPLIKGGVGSKVQNYSRRDEVWKDRPDELIVDGVVCFPCVLLRRRLIHAIGLLDENFTGYGMDDDDYCIRARRAGFWTMVTRRLYVVHGDGQDGLRRGDNYSVSFARIPPRDSPIKYFLTKYPEYLRFYTHISNDQQGISPVSM